jgi:hypothetical protein
VKKLCRHAGTAAASVLALACGATAAPAAAGAAEAAGPAPAAVAASTDATDVKAAASVVLEQCATAATQMERSATFAAEMTLVPGSTRMQMRLELLERTGQERVYHVVSATGLGSWRSAAAGVKVYRYVKQVTNLAAPAGYRAEVQFRWLNAHGRTVKTDDRRSAPCEELRPSETGATEAALQQQAPAAPIA